MIWLVALACTSDPAPPVRPLPPQTALSVPAPSPSGTARRIETAVESSEAIRRTQQRLDNAVRKHALNPRLPWAIGHALVALGPSLTLDNGADAVEWLFSEYGERVAIGDEWGVVFPERKGNILVEAHPSLFLKALADSGVDPKTPVTVAGAPQVVGDLYRGVLATEWFDSKTNRSSHGKVNEVAWSLFGLTSWSAPGTQWTDAKGRTSHLDALTNFAATALAADTRFLAASMETGTPFTKRGQGIFQYTCGGAHLIQAVVHANLLGFGDVPDEGPFVTQLRLLMHRLPMELAQIDAGMKISPRHAIPLAIQRLKLTGHALETLGRISASGHPNGPTQDDLALVIRELVFSVDLLDRLRVFEQLHITASENHQMFLDVVGDSAHALRGLAIVQGHQPVHY